MRTLLFVMASMFALACSTDNNSQPPTSVPITAVLAAASPVPSADLAEEPTYPLTNYSVVYNMQCDNGALPNTYLTAGATDENNSLITVPLSPGVDLVDVVGSGDLRVVSDDSCNVQWGRIDSWPATSAPQPGY